MLETPQLYLTMILATLLAILLRRAMEVAGGRILNTPSLLLSVSDEKSEPFPSVLGIPEGGPLKKDSPRTP